MTEAERERLTMLIEECGEVVQAATKCLRHGYSESAPGKRGTTDNRQDLTRELGDLIGIMGVMTDLRDISMERIYQFANTKWTRALPYTYHQGTRR